MLSEPYGDSQKIIISMVKVLGNMKKNVFAEIQRPYFNWLSSNFGNLANEARRHNVSPGDIAKDYLSNPKHRENLRSSLDYYFNEIENHWEAVHGIIENELQKLPGMKARFGGDIGPQSTDSIFASASLYFDTIVVPDPLLRIAKMPREIAKIIEYYFLKYSIEQVMAKDMYLAETYPPIAVLTADFELTKGNNFEELSNIARLDSVLLTNALYNKTFDSYQETIEFFNSFSSLEHAVKEVSAPELFYWIEDVPREPLEQLEGLLKRNNYDWEENEFVKYKQAQYLPFMFMGRMMQINDVFHRALGQNSHPIIAAPVSFHWLAWKIQANQNLLSEQVQPSVNLNLGLTNALLSQELNWLSNVPLENLIELRKQGQMLELRSLIGKEIASLSSLDLISLDKTINQVDYNLSIAFDSHQQKTRELDRKFHVDLAISSATFLLGVTATLKPSLFPLTPSWTQTLGIVGTTKLRDIVVSTIKYIQEKKALGKTPIGILWRTRKKES